ncbi:hypothetical protein SRHO_G00080650 [Serrasalmus rhombeus]
MPPKRVPTAMSQQQQREDDPLLPSSTEVASGDPPANVEQLCAMLQSFMTEQKGRDDYLQKEAAKQELRWRSMQHQFSLLQEEVHKGRAEGRCGQDQSEETTDFAHTQILRRTQAGSADQINESETRHFTSQVSSHTVWPTPRLPTLKESDDIEHFLTMFERIAQTANWPSGSWALHLVPLLEGKARAAYVAMDGMDIGNYYKVKDAILRKYEINKDTYRQRFRTNEIREAETPRELYTRLKGLYEKWMTPQEKSKEEIGDEIVLEQYLRMVRPELRRWIIERSPGSTLQAVEMSEAFVAARQSEGNFRFDEVNKSRQHVELSKFVGGRGSSPMPQYSRPPTQGRLSAMNVRAASDRRPADKALRDVPVLIDLLTHKQNTADVMAVTRLQAKQESIAGENQTFLRELPYNEIPKIKKSKRQRRQDKVRGTAIVEQLECPDIEVDSLPSNVAQLQRQDKSLVPLFLKAESPSVEKSEIRFVIIRDILFRVKGEIEQLVVPVGLRQEVLKLGHTDPWAGHLGYAKTYSRVANRFYWPRQQLDIIEFCKACPECQLTAPKKKSDRVPMISLPVIDVPFSRIAMDVVGPLPKSQSGKRYILVISDYATRYPEAFALSKVKTRQLVNALLQLISRVGIPREILTDQGTNFTSKQFKDVFALMGIKGIRTTPFHPQTDGLVERFNKTLKCMLRKFVSETGSDWDRWLPFLLFAYREVPQASTGFSPFQLLYGREVTLAGSNDTHTMAGRGRGQDTFNVFSPLVGRGRALHMSDETIGLPHGLQLTRDSPLGSRGTPRNVPAMPTCSTPRDNNSDVTQQLRELIGELGSQIGETIASRILANQSPVTTTPLAPPCNRETESLNNSLDLSKMSVVVRSDIKEPPMFRGDDSDKYTVQEWIDVMELYLHKSSCPDTERSNTILSHLLGRAKNIVKVGLKSSSAPNTVVSSEKIYDVLKRYFSDSPVSSLPLADFYATRPKDKESPVDYWVRLNATAERAANYLQQNGGKMENINAEIAMMFIRNCNSPDLSSVFKCKPMIKWSIEEVQEAIDEYQRESQSRNPLSMLRPRTVQVASAAAAVSSEQAAEDKHTIVSSAQSVSNNTSNPPENVAASPNALERVLSMLEKVLERTSQSLHSPAVPHVSPWARGVACRVCSDTSHSTRSHCMKEKRCLACLRCWTPATRLSQCCSTHLTAQASATQPGKLAYSHSGGGNVSDKGQTLSIDDDVSVYEKYCENSPNTSCFKM